MNGLGVCALICCILYVLLFNWELLKIFLIVYGLYNVLTVIYYPFGSKYNTARKKVSALTWSDPYGPEIYSCLKVRFSSALSFISEANKIASVHITPTHLLSKAVSLVIEKFPQFNAKITLGNIVPYDTIDVSCLVSLDQGSDLGFVCFRSANTKSVSEIAEESRKRVESVRTGKERKQHEKATGPFGLIPTCLGGILIEIGAWASVSLGIDLSFMGISKHPCGPAVITNIGMLGGETVYAPFPTVLKIPLIIVMQAIKDEIVVDQGNLVIDKVLTLTITVDHRFIDGVRAAKAQQFLKQILENPQDYIKV